MCYHSPVEIGLLGLAQSGKTTLFRALTQGRGEGVGVVKVPDPRLKALEGILHPKKTVLAEVHYVDAPPPPKGLPSLSSVHALLYILRVFPQENIPHPLGTVDPHRDLATLEAELFLADLAILENRLERIAASVKGGKGEREALLREQALLSRIKTELEQNHPLRKQALTAEEGKALEGFNLLTAKPVMAVLNLGEGELSQAHQWESQWQVRYPSLLVVALCAQLEMELAQLPEAEAREFRSALGAEESGLERLIRLSQQLLGLISFFTVVSDEVRAWVIPRGIVALKAAGKVHTDMERGFIRAEVVAFDDLSRCGSLAEARKRGLLRLEGKNYPVQDGDIVTFLFHI